MDANVELGNYDEAVKLADKMVEIRPDLRSYSRVSYLREIHGDVDGADRRDGPGREVPRCPRSRIQPPMAARQTMGELHLCRYGMPDKAGGDAPRRAGNDRANYPFAIAGLAELEMDKGNYPAAAKVAG